MISFGKFGILFYTISLASIALNSTDNFRYLKNGSPILKLSATYIQDRTNSNIRRKMKILFVIIFIISQVYMSV